MLPEVMEKMEDVVKLIILYSKGRYRTEFKNGEQMNL